MVGEVVPQNNALAQKVVERNLVVPAQDTEQEVYNQVSIIRGLSTENDLIKIELRLRGYTYNIFKKQWILSRRPIMNNSGIGNFMSALQGVGDNVDFSNYNEKDVGKLALMFFEDNYPQFMVYNNDFELNSQDFNVIKTILKFWCLSVLNNAKGAGHRNVVRGTLSEGILARALGSPAEEKKKGGIFSFLRRNKGANN
jgi:hypothetical protein